MTDSKSRVSICNDCGLFGSCKNPKACHLMQHSKDLGLGSKWAEVHQQAEANDSPDEITWNYYVSHFSWLAGKGVDLTKIIVLVPLKFVAYDCLYGALLYCTTVMKCRLHEASADESVPLKYPIKKDDQIISIESDKFDGFDDTYK